MSIFNEFLEFLTMKQIHSTDFEENFVAFIVYICIQYTINTRKRKIVAAASTTYYY